MRFGIPFDKQIFRNQNELWFDSVWQKNVKKNKSGFYYGITFMILGALIIYGKGNLGYFFICMGMFLIITAYRYYHHYNKRKKIYFDLVERLVEKYEKSKLESVFEFNDDYFFYKDFRLEIKFNWIAFTGFKLIEDNLFLFFDDQKQIPYIIGKEEVSNVDFDNIIQFLNRKRL